MFLEASNNNNKDLPLDKFKPRQFLTPIQANKQPIYSKTFTLKFYFLIFVRFLNPSKIKYFPFQFIFS